MKFTDVVKPQGFFGRLADMLMLPVMYLIQRSFYEVPQRTHFWNNIKIRDGWTIDRLRMGCYFLAFRGDPSASARRFFGIPLMHLGGWKTFKVIEPENHTDEWFVGWYPGDEAAGVSQVPLTGPVRVLIGQGEVSFFALDRAGNSLPLRQVGGGKIGQAGTFAKIPLL